MKKVKKTTCHQIHTRGQIPNLAGQCCDRTKEEQEMGDVCRLH